MYRRVDWKKQWGNREARKEANFCEKGSGGQITVLHFKASNSMLGKEENWEPWIVGFQMKCKGGG